MSIDSLVGYILESTKHPDPSPELTRLMDAWMAHFEPLTPEQACIDLKLLGEATKKCEKPNAQQSFNRSLATHPGFMDLMRRIHEWRTRQMTVDELVDLIKQGAAYHSISERQATTFVEYLKPNWKARLKTFFTMFDADSMDNAKRFHVGMQQVHAYHRLTTQECDDCR